VDMRQKQACAARCATHPCALFSALYRNNCIIAKRQTVAYCCPGALTCSPMSVLRDAHAMQALELPLVANLTKTVGYVCLQEGFQARELQASEVDHVEHVAAAAIPPPPGLLFSTPEENDANDHPAMTASFQHLEMSFDFGCLETPSTSALPGMHRSLGRHHV
jgi:hypothetical protein